MNPYEVLGIAQNASISEIEDAYDTLFDQSEPHAQAGDADAIAFLHDLNEARDTLVDPDSRAALDARLAQAADRQRRRAEQAARPPRPTPAPPTPPRERPAQQRSASTRSQRPQARAGDRPTTIRTRRRASYALEVYEPRRNWLSYWPYFAVILVLGFALAVTTTFLASRGSCVPADLPTGPAVATVNDVPIYQRELDEREAIDKQGALSDPLFQAFFDPNTITGTRALDTLKYDSLDKLVNMEVIVQQAKKEGVWPTDAQQKSLIQQAAAGDEQPGESFEQLLCRLNVSEAKYSRAVIENVVYSVMANEHMPQTGSDAARTDGFIKWICDTRQSYSVSLLMTFLVKDNPPCTSGLPSDVPLPGLGETPVPEPVESVAPRAPTAQTPAPEPVETVESQAPTATVSGPTPTNAP